MEIRRKIVITSAFGIAVYAALMIYADVDELLCAAGSFKVAYLPAILALTCLNYALRFLKWDYYLGCLGIRVSKRRSAGIFLSGLSMSVTPAKLGETFKSYLLKESDNIEISRTIPVVLAERCTDLIGLIILASVGYSAFDYGREVLAITLLMILFPISIIQSRQLCSRLINSRMPIISKFAYPLCNLYESAYTLFSIKTLFITILISTVSWFFECLALFFVLKGFGLDTSPLLSLFAYSFSTIVGAVSMIPGGLGISEGSLAGILILNDISRTIAVASTLIIRFCTLWFGVIVGILTLSIYGFKTEEAITCQE